MKKHRYTNKERLQILLDGGIPDAPPHWELVFQIPKEMFGMDADAVEGAKYDTEVAREDAMLQFHTEVAWRLIEECGWAAVPAHNAYNAEYIGRIKSALGAQALIPGFEGAGVFWLLPGSQMMDFAVKLFERPEELHQEARLKCEAAKECLRQMAEAGADFFVLTYDFGYNNAAFVSPARFRDLVTPYLTEIVQTAHDLGKRAILHSDGHLMGILDQLYETGLDGYQSVDPQGHMDIKIVRERYPDWLLMGNVPCSLLQDVDETRIREAVRYCMTYGGMGKRYIFSTSNCIFAGMPADNYRLMLEEYKRMIGGYSVNSSL